MTLILPKSFINSVCNCDGFDETAFTQAHQTPSPVSVRLNPFKTTQLSFDLADGVLWNNKGFYLKERPNFTYDPLFQAGCYYVQEAGSMFIEYALKSCIDFTNTLKTLDLCASPGGKSTLLNSLLSSDSLLVANEVVKQRADILSQNICKWGTNNVVVTNNDPSAFNTLKNYFDIILVDAPCSGSGLFRKQHDAINEWSLDNVNLCSQRQKRILSEIIDSLADGGVLVYSTCSYSWEENEQIIDWIITEYGLNSLKIPIETSWGIIETQSDTEKAFGYRFYPDKTKSEGFFCAIFQKNKNTDSSENSKKPKKETFSDISQKEKDKMSLWIDNPLEKTIIPFKDDYLLINKAVLQFINKYPHLYYKKVGTNIGSLVKQDIIPHHDLALSIHVSKNIQYIDCNDEEAISFLRKEPFIIQGEKGWNLMRYNGFGIGWIKHLGNRINNYLPNEFRILNPK